MAATGSQGTTRAGTCAACSRRRFIASLALAGSAGWAASCKERSSNSGGAAPGGDEVVLYCSADSVYARPVLDRFEAATRIAVRTVFDTEATKTTGLVLRLVSEKDHPRADVWWSSEAMGTVSLERQGILSPCTSHQNERDFPGGWPPDLRSRSGCWYGFAQRARIIVYNTTRVADRPPALLTDLAAPRLQGRIGMARPQFGTTRGHMAALLVDLGEQAFRALLNGLRDNGLRLYDGNSSVVRAVAQGEIDAGLTDTDDARAGKREGWPVQVGRADSPVSALRAFLPILTPNTVALVRAGPNPANAVRLLGWLLGAATERALAESDSGNLPVRPAVAAAYPGLSVPGAHSVDWEAAEAASERALSICDDVLRGL